MVMILREGGHDAGAELDGLGWASSKGGDFFQMVVQQPGVIDQGQEDQGLRREIAERWPRMIGLLPRWGSRPGRGRAAARGDVALPAPERKPAAHDVAAGGKTTG